MEQKRWQAGHHHQYVMAQQPSTVGFLDPGLCWQSNHAELAAALLLFSACTPSQCSAGSLVKTGLGKYQNVIEHVSTKYWDIWTNQSRQRVEIELA